MYHQPRFRSIGHKILRATSESLSSEGSCQQNSPEYIQEEQPNQYEEESNEEEYWEQQKNGQVWKRENSVTERSNHDSSSEEEDNDLSVQKVTLDRKATDANNMEPINIDYIEEDSLVEGDDYDVIQVYAVHPDFDLEASSDEEEQKEYSMEENGEESETEEYVNTEDNAISSAQENHAYNETVTPEELSHDGLGINLDAPVVSNVDEYFIKDSKEKEILEVKDKPVVNDVDEYFIKEIKHEPSVPSIPNVDDFFIKSQVPQKKVPDFSIPKVTPTVTDIFDVPNGATEEVNPDPTEVQEANADVPINEADLDVLPNIEEIKKYLLEDIPYMKFKNAQKSCSVPHSPMHSICVDLDAKTCLSFEDLNLDLSDLNFDSDRDKSANSSKSEDIPRTLTDEDVNSFLITDKSRLGGGVKTEDDLNPQDMDIDGSIETEVEKVDTISPLKVKRHSSPPISKSNVLEFCIEKAAVKKESELKVELDDFVDVESCNETVIPVLEANNLSSLLEQFEATENFNTKPKRPAIKVEPKAKTNGSLANGMRLQDAVVQLNKNKMRQIMMPSTLNAAMGRSPSPVHSDHDYCSSKKRHSLPSLKGGQSLLKPEVLSSNSRILNSRHRSCKNKKVVYHLSSDDEAEKSGGAKAKKLPNGRPVDDNDARAKKSVVRQPVKATVPSTCRKRNSPASDVCLNRSNGSVIVKSACKASDNPISQSSNGSIRLTIKNKSEVIIKNCDDSRDCNQKDRYSDRGGTSSVVSDKSMCHVKIEPGKSIDSLDRNQIKEKHVRNVEVNKSIASVKVKEEPNPKVEHFYTALFSNKQDVQIPRSIDIKTEKRSHEDDFKSTNDTIVKVEVDQPQKKKKLNLQEYKLRRGVSSNNSSATVSPEAIFPDMPIPDSILKAPKMAASQTPLNGAAIYTTKPDPELPKKVFDPIREASRKILMNTKKQKAEAMRKRDEDIVMSKIPKVENLELQPLISDAEMLKIVGMGAAAEILPTPLVEKPPQLSDYDEIVLVSVGTNTDEEVFRKLQQAADVEKAKPQTPPAEAKSTINFRIKKSDHVLKHNVFDAITAKDRPQSDERKHADAKIDKERFRDITATLKSVERQVETKISSNSLFASIQDVVMKKAPEVTTNGDKAKPASSAERRVGFKHSKATIVREYDATSEHGEDKVILHLEKKRRRPTVAGATVQTDTILEPVPPTTPEKTAPKEEPASTRKRNDSDMSMSSDGSPERAGSKPTKEARFAAKPRPESRGPGQAREKRSRSKDRYEPKNPHRPGSPTKGHRGKRPAGRNRSRSRSRSRYRRYRRSDSPYRRKQRTQSRSPYRKRRSPTPRPYRNRSRSRSRHAEPARSKSPKRAKPPSPQFIDPLEKKSPASQTPPPRKQTVSESSDSSSSSASSSSSSSSSASAKSTRSSSPYRNEEGYKKTNYRSAYSSEDRESNTPVEERRIVFVGKLEKDINKSTLRGMFSKFGLVTEVRLHTKEDGSRYGFVTYRKSRDAWAAVEAAATFPQYDVGFGGRRAFCRQSYADLDGLEAKYTESAFHGQAALPARRNDDMSFEQMLLDVKKKLNQRKGDKKRHDDTVA
ncbi:unnamed protein product, partial [Iphiclides podalirius]